VNSLSQVTATLKDHSGEGIALDASTIRLEDPQGVEVPGIQTDDDQDAITWELTISLPTDGSVDGTYTIKVSAVDKDGEITEESFAITYDTQVPAITSITPVNGSVLTTSPSEIVVQASDGTGSGIDFASSKGSMRLRLNNADIPNILRKDNGVDTMTFSFPELEDTGEYTIEITLSDRAGNEYTYQSKFDFTEETIDVLPEVVSVEPPERSSVNSLSQVSATLKDNSGEGIDLDASTIRLEDPQGIEVPGVQTDDDKETIIWELTVSLPTDGSVDGTYTIKVIAVDKEGGTTEESLTITYDTQVPAITSITPPNGSILTVLSEVVIQVSDGAGSGVDFDASKSTMSLTGVSNILRKDNGVDTMTFSFPELEDTGKYTIEITLSDRAGNEYKYQSKFDFVEKQEDILPEVVSVEPAERSFVNALLQVSATLKDNSNKGINLDTSTIRLEDPQGVEVPGVQTDDDKETITWELTEPLPTDGSVDGTYTIKVSAVDKTGGTTEENPTFLYDTLSPSVVATTPAASDVFYEGISQVVAQFNDGNGSGVDLEETDISLQGPVGQVQADKGDNGKDTITLSFSTLTDSGNYVIQISPKDRAGNSGYPVEIKFSYVLKAPAVKSVTLTNRAYVKELELIEAVLEDRSGIGLDLSETGSSIVVTGPDGKLQADQASVDPDTIIWRPVHSLATDGTDDGTYTVTVTPMDTTGASGQSRNYTLIYDTQPPEVVSAAPVDINADITHVSQQLTAVEAAIRDEGPADRNRRSGDLSGSARRHSGTRCADRR